MYTPVCALGTSLGSCIMSRQKFWCISCPGKSRKTMKNSNFMPKNEGKQTIFMLFHDFCWLLRGIAWNFCWKNLVHPSFLSYLGSKVLIYEVLCSFWRLLNFHSGWLPAHCADVSTFSFFDSYLSSRWSCGAKFLICL